MSTSLIYAKTAQGVEEIRTRAAGLSATARRVLIMIDGKRDEDELRLVVRDGELDGVIATLLAQGLIEACGMVEPPEREWLADDAATVAMEPTSLRLDLGLGVSGGAATANIAPPPADAPVPTSRAAGPPPTLRMAIAEVDRRTPAPAPAPVPAPTTIIIKPMRTRPAPAPSAAQDAASASLEEAKRNAVRALYERLGPYGEEPAARINDCKSHEALREQIRHACRRITTFRGAPAAREYLASIGMT
ncbi:MAG: hypothetical protein MUC86_08505 [Burkholderiaceae bacterium]|jgi:hypothetical protein|nr:hypothetical protein [Burkholderiaceae bacterium]